MNPTRSKQCQFFGRENRNPFKLQPPLKPRAPLCPDAPPVLPLLAKTRRGPGGGVRSRKLRNSSSGRRANQTMPQSLARHGASQVYNFWHVPPPVDPPRSFCLHLCFCGSCEFLRLEYPETKPSKLGHKKSQKPQKGNIVLGPVFHRHLATMSRANTQPLPPPASRRAVPSNPNGILAHSPTVARHELPWVIIPQPSSTPTGLRPRVTPLSGLASTTSRLT